MTTALPKKSSTPVVLALIALLLTAGGCLAGTFSGWSYRASETSWDMGGLGSEGRSFGRRLERESREQAAARILPSGFCALCCLGIAALLALVGFHSALNQRDNGVLPLVPLAIAAAAMLFGAVVFAHAGFLSEESERIE